MLLIDASGGGCKNGQREPMGHSSVGRASQRMHSLPRALRTGRWRSCHRGGGTGSRPLHELDSSTKCSLRRGRTLTSNEGNP